MIGLIFLFMVATFCVLFAYLYAYVLFGVLNLSKNLSVKISFLVFYAIFTLLVIFFGFNVSSDIFFGFNVSSDIFFGFNVSSVIVVPIMILLILILKRSGYFTNFTKARVAMAGVCLLVFTWQLEVPQKIVFDIASKALKTKAMKEVFIENIDENATFLTANKTLLDCEDKNIACPFFSFKYPIDDIKARIDGEEKLVGRIYGIAYSASTLARFLSFARTKRLRYFTNISE